MSALARALLDELEPDDLAELAGRLIDYLPAPAVEDRWLTTREAATHLGLTPNAVHKLVKARAIPFEQDAPGCKCYFRRADLDAWRAR
jgi:excisionase family DNA binding protein